MTNTNLPDGLVLMHSSSVKKMLRLMTERGEKYEFDDCVQSLLCDLLDSGRQGLRNQWEYARLWGWTGLEVRYKWSKILAEAKRLERMAVPRIAAPRP